MQYRHWQRRKINRKAEWEGVNWIHLAQDRDKWQAVVNTVMNLRFPYNCEIFYMSEQLLASEKDSSS
jgi:hypothetical protein